MTDRRRGSLRSGELGGLRDALERRPGTARPEPAPLPTTTSARVGAVALLPLRFFLGITFVYAGLDKILDPAFFNAADPASIQSQLAAFARVSPVAPLVHLGEPFAVPIGLLIAVAEIAVGLGALSGLAYRLAAGAGAALSILFWLTASWATSPYYYGPDLPYAAGWLTLALAGHAGLLVPRAVMDIGRSAAAERRRGWVPGAPPASRDRRSTPAEDEGVLSRRAILQVGVLGIASIALAAAASPLRFLRPTTGRSVAGSPSPLPRPTPAAAGSTPTATPGAPAATTPAPTSGPVAGTLRVASVSQVTAGNALAFTVPFDAPAPLPAGDPGVIVRLASGSFVAFDAVCTHEGCTVEWDGQDGVLLCPCHGAAFDVEHNGRVLAGPARRALPSLPLVVDQATGTISLRA